MSFSQKAASATLSILAILSWHLLVSSCQSLTVDDQMARQSGQLSREDVLATFKGWPTYDPDRHYFLIPGGGPRVFTRMIGLDSAMLASGIPEDQVHLLHYDHRQPLKKISDDIAAQIRKVIDQLDENVRFDVIAHSLGDFVGLHAIVTNQLQGRFERYISLAGVKFGQNSKPSFCWFGCSDVYHFLTPYRNERLLEFHHMHKDAISEMSHCAISSKDDWLVNDPINAGEMPDGRNIQVKGFGHTSFHTARAWPLIIKACFIPLGQE